MKISIRRLYFLSALYIILPLVIFIFGWMKPIFAWSIFLSFLTLLFFLQRNKQINTDFTISLKELGLLFLILTAWTVLSGAGHRGYLDGDGYKHNAILNDLIFYDWPVAYQPRGVKDIVYLCYYIAYYLPSALVGKLLGWKAGNIVLFGWTLAGVGIAFLWFISLCKKGSKTLYSLLFIFFGGLDIIGRFILRNKQVSGGDWEWWARNWQYSGNTTLLYYVPQHAIIGWIMMGILLYGILNKRSFPFFILLLACTPLWSPFVFLGVLPFAGVYIWNMRKHIYPIEWGVSVLFLAFQFLYFASNLTFIVRETGASAWLWQIEKLFHSWVLLRLFLFYLFEFGLFMLAIHFFYKQGPDLKRKMLFFTSLIILLVLPWYKMGLLNDFVMRVSIPALYVVCLLWISLLMQEKINIRIKIILLVIFILAAVYPTRLIFNGIIHFSWGPPKTSLTTYQDPQFRKQYLGKKESLFFSFFANINKTQKVGQMKYK